MRTVLVNPVHSRGSYGGSRGIAVVRNAPRRRRRRNAGRRRRHNPALPSVPVMMANPRRRRRMSNPLVLPNAPRRRRRRNPAFNLDSFMRTAATGAIAGAGTYLVNKFGISRLGVDESGNDTQNGIWVRQFARLALGALAAHFLPGATGSAINGAMMYPMASEFDAFWSRSGNVGGVPAGSLTGGSTSASLQADLNDILDGLY